MSNNKLRKVLFSISFLISLAAFAQTDTVKTTLIINSDTTVNNLVNNATILINNGALTINGNFVNHGVITNKDSIIVKGNWSDSTPGALSVGGWVIFNGAGAQQLNIEGSDIFQNLTIAGGTKTLNGKAIIENKFNIQTIIQTATADTLLLDSAAVVVNASATSYVNGALFRRERDNSYPTDTVFFPVGTTSGNYRPVALNNFAGGSKKAIIRIIALSNLPAAAKAPTGAFLYSSTYWKVSVVAGTYTSGSAATLYYASSDIGGASSSSLSVAESNSSSGNFYWLGSSAYTSNSITSKIPLTYLPGPPTPGSTVYLALEGSSPVCSFSYTRTADTSVCGSSFSGTLKVNYTAGADSISWAGGGYTNNPTYVINNLTTSKIIYFTLKSTTAPNCFITDSVSITINSANPSWVVSDTNVCISNPSLQLTPVQPGGIFTGVGLTNNSGNWYFNPASVGAGVYKITYTVCSASSSHTITVNPGPCETTIISDNGGSGSVVANPQGIFTTCDGTIYFSNPGANTIYKVDPQGNATLLANAADGLSSPEGITVNENTGDIYFCDTGNDQIKKIDGVTGAITTIAGSGAQTSSVTPFTTDNTNGLAATFFEPVGIVIDYAGQYLYVTDSKDYRIARISLSGTDTVVTYAGQGINNPASSSDTLPNTRLLQKFGLTGQLAIDQNNNLYVPDITIRGVRIVKASVDSVETLITRKSGLLYPVAVAVNGEGDVYVSDYLNCTIYDYIDGSVSPIIGNPDSCGSSNPKYLSYPGGISFNAKGYLDVADSDNDAIKRFTLPAWSAFINFKGDFCITSPKDSLIPKYPGGYYISSPVSASVSQVSGQWYFNPAAAGVGAQKLGYVYTMESCTDTLFTTAIVRPLPKPNIGTDTTLCSYEIGVFQLNAGAPYLNYKWYDDNTLTSDTTQFYTVTDTGTFYVLVTDTSRAKCMGYSDTVHVKSQAVPPVTLAQPVPGNLCVGDTTSVVLTPQVSFGSIASVLWQDSTISLSYNVKGSGKYIAIATINLGSIQCINSDTTNIQYKLDPQVSIISSPTATTCNNYVFLADSIPAPAGGVTPSLKGIAKDSRGNLYVTDAANNVLWKITPSGSIYKFAGQVGVSSSTGTDTSNATFSVPYGIAIDNYAGDIYVSEQGTNIIRKITFSGQVSKFAGVIGSGGYNGPGYKDTTKFNMPSGIALTPAGGLYITDKGNNLVRKISATGSVTNIGVASDYNAPVSITAMKNGNLLVGNGSGVILMVNPFSNDSVTTYATITGGITGMVTDNTGRLYVSNASSNIINNINIDGTITTEGGSGTSGYQNGLASSAEFSQLGGMYMPGRGLPLYVTDGNTIRKIVDSCSVSVCDSISLTASPQNFTSYTWSQGATTISSATTVTTPPGLYALTVIGSNQCPGYDTLLVKQLPKPSQYNSASSQCIGYSATIGPAPLPNYKYVWTDGNTGGAPVGLSNNFVAQPIATPTQLVTTYVLTVTDTVSKCFNKDTVSFIVSIPNVFAGPDTSFCQGDSVQVGSINTVTTSTILTWSPSIGISDTSIAMPYVGGYLKAGIHTYVITARYTSPITHATCVFSDTVNVTTDSTPVARFTTNVLCIPGTAIFYDSSKSQDPIVQRNWIFGDGSSVTSPNPDTSHYYSSVPSSSIELTVTTSKGCKADTVVPPSALSFYPKPEAIIAYKQACIGSITQFHDASIVSPGTITSWDWNINSGAVLVNQTQDTTINYAYTGAGAAYNVSLAIETAAGCKGDTSIQVNMHTTPTAVISPAKSCTADSTPFSGSATGVDLQYKWYFGDGTGSSLMSPKHKYASSGNYLASLVVTDTSAFCSDSVFQNVVITISPTASFTASNVCMGDSVTFKNGSSSSGTLTYLWNFGDSTQSSSVNVNHKFTSSGPYAVELTVTDTSGCKAESIDTLKLNTPPNPTVVYDKSSVCNGATVTLNIQSTTAGDSIVWKQGGLVLATNQDSINVNKTGSYSLIISSSNGCIDSSLTPLVFINPPDTVKITIAPDTIVCLGDTVKLVGYSNGDSLSFLWSSAGSGILGNSGALIASYTPLRPDSNYVIVTFKSANRCAADSAYAKIYINPIPYPSFTYSPSPALVDDPVVFVNTTDTISSYINYLKWNFGDYPGDTSNLFAPPQHTYTDSGHYVVSLQATNKYNCKNTYIVDILVVNSHVVYIPNIFTPTKLSANAENRVCKVYGVDINNSGFSFNIYDRWGSIVFSTTDFTQANTLGWDGKNQNGGDIMAQMGVYTYVVKGKFQDGTPFEKVGTVTLAQ